MLGLTGKRELPTVLLIDDDMVSREVMATVLTMGGYTVHTAVNGATALTLLAGGECNPGAILMDAQMPGLSGRALIAELRARSQATLIAMSGSNAPGEVAAAADGFLLKPFGAEELGKLLEKREAQSRPARAEGTLDGPVVNAETLGQLRGMMPEKAVRQILAAVVTDLAKRQAALEAAVAKGDMAEVRRIGHAIKGGCGMAGASQAAQVGARLEALGAKTGGGGGGNELDNSGRLLSDLCTARENLERMLEAEFPG